MTREEAILHMTLRREELKHSVGDLDEDIKAFDMAIEALEQEPKTGHWIKYSIPRCGEQHYKCTSCGYYINFGQWGELYTKEFKYCPHCGAKMVEPQESEVQDANCD